MIRQLSILILCAWSASAVTTNVAVSVSATDVQAAVNLCNDGDWVRIPAGSATWTSVSRVSTTKAISIICSGQITSTVPTGGGDPTVNYTLNIRSSAGNLIQIIGLNIKGTVGGTGLLVSSPYLRITQSTFDSFAFGIYNFYGGGSNCFDHCTFSNNFASIRLYGGGPGGAPGGDNWTNFFPIAFNSLNYAFVEYCTFGWASPYWNHGNGHAVITSGQGSLWCARHNKIYSTDDTFEPCFDTHGDIDGSDRGGVASILYDNAVIMSGVADMDKFSDIRGGQLLSFNNSVVNPDRPGLGNVRGVALREEWPLALVPFIMPNGARDDHCLVTNAWSFAQTVNNVAMPTFVDDATGLINLGAQYFVSSPVPLLLPQDPHPLDTTPVTNSIVAKVTNFHAKNAHNGP